MEINNFSNFKQNLKKKLKSNNFKIISGEYAGFDENEPTSKTGGKGEVIRRLKEDKGFKTIVHVGDGATDLEACPPASAFIGEDKSKFHTKIKILRFEIRICSEKN